MEGDALWDLVVSHGTPYMGEKLEFWEQMQTDMNNRDKLWLLIGDLNEIFHEGEKLGGISIWKIMMFLKEFMNETEAIDLGFKFT